MLAEEIASRLPVIEEGEDKSSILKNRIRKNYRHARKWAKRTATDCFRIYDRDIKEYPLAIEFYAGRFSVQYFFYDQEFEGPPPALQQEVGDVLYSLFGATQDQIYSRVRLKRSRLEQYEKRANSKEFFKVYEHGTAFWVNLADYLDTGLFLDHRDTRQRIAKMAKGKSLLNLFAYTCSFSVQAAKAGASYTKSVDLSNTYTEWGTQNFALNDLSLSRNEVVRADCLTFLQEEAFLGPRYDLIVIDPPTISRSKKMDRFFDLQKDYVEIIEKSLKLLKEGGTLFFSTNARKFFLDLDAFKGVKVQEISKKTIPFDFHSQKIHRCWEFKKDANA
jgi:23S rRNA (cytosine1962-C5)-methyltransferase